MERSTTDAIFYISYRTLLSITASDLWVHSSHWGTVTSQQDTEITPHYACRIKLCLMFNINPNCKIRLKQKSSKKESTKENRNQRISGIHFLPTGNLCWAERPKQGKSCFLPFCILLRPAVLLPLLLSLHICATHLRKQIKMTGPSVALKSFKLILARKNSCV